MTMPTTAISSAWPSFEDTLSSNAIRPPAPAICAIM